MEIRRFGVGHRRPDGPPGTRGVEGQQIHADALGVISEMALRPRAVIPPHTNPNATYFVIVEGGGFVRVGEQTARVAAGEAVVWPPNLVRAVWTDLTPMRAIVVEFAAPPPAGSTLVLEAEAVDPSAVPSQAEGALAPKPPIDPVDHKSPEQEPW